ncbi:MAG: toll/interleukin-1 receptor domain-containing protein [Lachnospiraceae bacterium]|nr:toll/interleukin-1 receptor domain-containing protein [Lachnospiraceae bacterium]
MGKNTAYAEDETPHYDAFISYSHAELDSFVARKLHRKLEHYRIPARLRQDGAKRLKVFRDKEELALSSDLTSNIYDALKHSNFLIVLCSDSSQESVWVHREIEYFAQWHGTDHILILLLDGEPGERFPVFFAGIQGSHAEPFAADIRGNTARESARKLEKEFLRIIAPILGCSYDTLRQRDREYQMKKTIASLTAVVCLALSFAGFAVYKNMQISEQYQLSQQNLARYLSSEALTLLNQGDRAAALSEVLKVLPEDGSEDPVVPEQMYVLNEALRSYQRNDNFRYSPDFTVELDDNITAVIACNDDAGRYLLCLGEKGNAYFLDLDSAQVVWTVSPGDFDTRWTSTADSAADASSDADSGAEPADDSAVNSAAEPTVDSDTDPTVDSTIESAVGSAFINGAFAAENTAVLMTGHAFLVLDIENQTCTRIITDDCFENEENTVFAVSESYLAVGYENSYSIFTLSDGELYYSCDIMDDFYHFSNIRCLAVSPDEAFLAIGTQTYNWDDSSDSEDTQKDDNLYLLDLTSLKTEKLAAGNVLTLSFVDDSTLGAVHFDSVSESAIGYMYNEYDYYAALYDVRSASQIWEGEKKHITTSYSMDSAAIGTIDSFTIQSLPDEYTASLVFFTIQDTWIVVEYGTWDPILQFNFEDTITGVSDIDTSNILVGLENGTVYRSMLTTLTEIYQIDAEVSFFSYDADTDRMIQTVSDSPELIFSSAIVDETMECIGDEMPETSFCYEADSNEDSVTQKGRETDITATYDGNGIIEVRDTDNTVLLSVVTDRSDHLLFGFLNHDQYLLIYNYDYCSEISIWEISSQSLISSQKFDLEEPIKDQLFVDEDGIYFALNLSSGNVVRSDNSLISRKLDVFTVDYDMNICRYASITYGEVNFDKMELYSYSSRNKLYYSSHFYTFSELKEWAEEVMSRG